MVFFKQDEGRRVPRQPALEGRRRHRRRRQGVRRRRPQERRRLHRPAAPIEDRVAERLLVDEGRARAIDGRPARRRQAGRARPRTTSSRGCGARCARRGSATPARSIRWRPACCRWSSAARRGSRVPERERQGVRGGRPPRVRDRHRRRAGRSRSAPSASGRCRRATTIDAALDAFRGTFLQQPPAFSAKKIDGRRSYELARRRAAARAGRRPAACTCPARPARPVQRHGARARHRWRATADSVTLRVDCSAGFYVRSLAHDLGRAARRRRAPGGAAAHAERRLRTRPARWRSTPLERDPQRRGRRRWCRSRGMLPALPAVDPDRRRASRRVGHGQDIRPADRRRSATRLSPVALEPPSPLCGCSTRDGELVAIAEPTARRGFCIRPLFWCNMLILLD